MSDDGAMYSGIIPSSDRLAILAQTGDIVTDTNFRKLNDSKFGVPGSEAGGGGGDGGAKWIKRIFNYSDFAKDDTESDQLPVYGWIEGTFVIVEWLGFKVLETFAGSGLSNASAEVFVGGNGSSSASCDLLATPSIYPGGGAWDFQIFDNPTQLSGESLPRYDGSGTYLNDNIVCSISCNINCDQLTAGRFVVYGFIHVLSQSGES